MEKIMLDCIVIGAGPAGLSAAIYLVRKKMETIVLSTDFGGQMAKSAEVENYLGFKKLSGLELTQAFVDHSKEIGVEIENDTVEHITKIDDGFEVKTSQKTYQTKGLVIASGKTPRQLNIPGEDKYLGKGVGYCATCDGPLFHGKSVAVIGGGNSALDSALEMEKYAAKVYMINLNADFQGDEIRKDRVKASEKIEIINEAETTEILGEAFMTGLKVKTKEGEKTIEAQGVFVEIGWEPATEILKDLVELNEMNEIKIDRENKTSCEGIYAAGDVTDEKNKQIIIAAGEGAKAALNIWKYLVLKQ
jgi:alkyl hydroperoxide reductase subunit F